MWAWLPRAVEPVVAGRVAAEGEVLVFNYGRSYLNRLDAISLYDAELPLRGGALPPLRGLTVAGCLRDAAPDAWGRRVLLNRLLGERGPDADVAHLDELTYLLESGSDRVGALDFQASPTRYIPRLPVATPLEELARSVEKVEAGLPLSPELDQALQHGSSIGGARPKASIEGNHVKYIAKFSSSTDLYRVVKAEFVAMRLAALCGLEVARVELATSSNRDVLLVERFDRVPVGGGWQRRAVVSALTLLELDELMARYASYEDLAEIIRHRFSDPAATLRELFGRLVFNVLCGNTDDHARNHAAFWDGRALTLTPAYDVCPQARTGNEATQAMTISGENRLSRISACLEAARHFLLSQEAALSLATEQVKVIGEEWDRVCDQARLPAADRGLLWGRQFLNRFAFDDLAGEALPLRRLAEAARVGRGGGG